MNIPIEDLTPGDIVKCSNNHLYLVLWEHTEDRNRIAYLYSSTHRGDGRAIRTAIIEEKSIIEVVSSPDWFEIDKKITEAIT
jgi:hypothetical protein